MDIETQLKDLAHRIREARTAAGLSIGQAAKLMAVTVDELVIIEQSGLLDSRQLYRFAEVYFVSLIWLVTGTRPGVDFDAEVARFKQAGMDESSAHDMAKLMQRRQQNEYQQWDARLDIDAYWDWFIGSGNTFRDWGDPPAKVRVEEEYSGGDEQRARISWNKGRVTTSLPVRFLKKWNDPDGS